MRINIPTSLHEISLGDHQKFISIVNQNVKQGEEISEEMGRFINNKAIEIFCRVEAHKILKLPVSVYNVAVEAIQNVLNQKPVLYKEIHITAQNGKVDLGFIPNIEKMTFGEYVDLNNYTSDWDKMHLAMAVLYRPITARHKDRYTIAEYEGSETWGMQMKQVPVYHALAAQLFFWNLTNELLIAMETYFPKVLDKNLRKEDLLKSGDGIQLSKRLQEAMSLNSMPSLN